MFCLSSVVCSAAGLLWKIACLSTKHELDALFHLSFFFTNLCLILLSQKKLPFFLGLVSNNIVIPFLRTQAPGAKLKQRTFLALSSIGKTFKVLKLVAQISRKIKTLKILCTKRINLRKYLAAFEI